MSDEYRVSYEDLSQQVYRILRTMILSGELKSGQKLAQDELAERLGVSRTPLLSALSKLEREMLVEMLPRRGAYVREFSPDELVHVYDIRLRLEPLGAAEAARLADEEGIRELRGLSEAFRLHIADDPEVGAVREADYHLHMKIMELSRNQLLLNIISTFNIIVIANSLGLLKPAAQSDAEHQVIVEAIESHATEAAEAAMTEHLLSSRKRIVEIAAAADGAKPGL